MRLSRQTHKQAEELPLKNGQSKGRKKERKKERKKQDVLPKQNKRFLRRRKKEEKEKGGDMEKEEEKGNML